MNGERKKGIGKDSGKQDTGGETRTICMYGVRKGFVYSHSGDNGRKDPPVPIPNTEVKLSRAESTCRDTDREDRSSPLFKNASSEFFSGEVLFTKENHAIVAWLKRGLPMSLEKKTPIV